MTASLGYLFLRQVLQMLTQPARDDGAKDVELLVLRHPVAVLRRQVTRPQVEPADRVVPAARSRLLPPSRWPTVFVTPATPDPRWVDQRILAGSRSAIDLASPTGAAALAVRRGKSDTVCDASGVEAVPLRHALCERNWPPCTLTGLNVTKCDHLGGEI
jgi:hypothetical protein